MNQLFSRPLLVASLLTTVAACTTSSDTSAPAAKTGAPQALATTSAADSTNTLTGLTNVAVNHAATQSSTNGSATASLAIDGSSSTAASTNPETNPDWSVDLTYDRSIQAVSISSPQTNLLLQLVDSGGNVVAAESMSGVASQNGAQTFYFNPPVTARSVRIMAFNFTGAAPLVLNEVQVFTQLVPVQSFAQASTDAFCWKRSSGRGAGVPLDACPGGTSQDGALCYPNCAAGFYGVGPVCWQSCPSGWEDTGVGCLINASVISADNSSCPWYDECGLTFAKGCSTCPPGYSNDGCTCSTPPQEFTKESYGRGAGVPMVCDPSLEQNGALCYPPCTTGYTGLGPVCWSNCGGNLSAECIAGCADTEQDCLNFLTNATTSVIDAFQDISSMVVSFGESAEAISVARAAALDAGDASILQNEILNQLQSQAGDLAQTTLENTASIVVNGVQTGQLDWTQLDPTGIAAVVQAFDHPICSN